MKMHPKMVGDISEAQVFAALLKKGHCVLTPFGENHRYDFAIESEGRFIRVQCKTGRLKNGAIVAKTSSNNSRQERRDYRGEADVFGVYCPETEQAYLVPVDIVPKAEMYLRVERPKNGQTKGVLWANKFVI